MRQGKPQHLASENAFARYSSNHKARSAHSDADRIMQQNAQRHCAGQDAPKNGARLLNALRAQPGTDPDADATIRWLIGSITIPDCMLLVSRCGIRYEDLARHLRTRPQQPQKLIRFLNQFTVNEDHELSAAE